MFCEHCGNKLKESFKFCTKCGQPAFQEAAVKIHPPSDLIPDQKWWFRLAKVIYILLYIPLPLVLYVAWNVNSSSYDYSTHQLRMDTSGAAFWYSLLTFVIYLAIIRLIKITFLYITFGQKTQWEKEFKKLF